MPRKSTKAPIPGIKEVPMPPASSPLGKMLTGAVKAMNALVTPVPEPVQKKAARRPRASSPKDVRFVVLDGFPEHDGALVQIWKGSSPCPAVTLTEAQERELMIAVWGKDWQVLADTYRQERDATRERAEKADARIFDLARKLEGAEAQCARLITERDAARRTAKDRETRMHSAIQAKALAETERDQARERFDRFHQHLRGVGIPLRNTGDFMDDSVDLDAFVDRAQAYGQLVKQRDTAQYNAKQWEKAAGKNLDDLNATKADLTMLQANFDQLNDDFRAEKSARKAEALSFAAELHKRKALGWMWAGITLIGCLAAFVASIRFGLIGGGR